MSKGGGGGKTSTTVKYPDWVNAAAKDNLAYANNIAALPYQPYQGPRIADFTDTQKDAQQKAIDFANSNVGLDQINAAQARTSELMNFTPSQIAAKAYDPALATSQGYDAATAAAAAANRGDVRNVGGGSFLNMPVGAYANPFVNQVVNTTLNDLDRSRILAQQGNAAAAAKSGAFGGSRQGVLEAETNRNFFDTAARTAAGLRSDAYNAAANLAGQDLQRGLQANLANQGVDLQTILANAGFTQQANLANQGALNAASQFGANAANNVSLANAAARNQASQFNNQLDYNAQAANQNAGIQAANINAAAANQLANLGLTERSAAQQNIDTLNTVGGQQRALDQANYDLAYQNFQDQRDYPLKQLAIRQSGLSNTPYGGTTTQTASAPQTNPIGGALGGALAGASLFGTGGALAGSLGLGAGGGALLGGGLGLLGAFL